MSTVRMMAAADAWQSGTDFIPPSVIATEIARILSDRIVFLELAPGTPHS